MRYQIPEPFQGRHSGIIRIDDDGSTTAIPESEENSDWRAYQTWREQGNAPDPYVAPEPPRRLVAKSLIVERLNAAGKLPLVKAALDANLYARERWYAADKPAVYVNDPEVLGLLTAIGADPDVILAPE